ncbi:MAG: CRISPR-associated protein Cas4 [Chloroflexia bacterium]|nr:CRISPR-associated protein Cas4 [Chloroflexia bacterium]
MNPVLLLSALLLSLLALLLLRRAGRERAESGLPQGRVVYVDDRDWRIPPAPLRSPQHGLVGRPDYLMRRHGDVIPVECKPSRRSCQPYEADILQLAAYCLLVEENYGAPPYGLLCYRDYTFEIPYDQSLRQDLLFVLQEMRQAVAGDEVWRSHDEPARCVGCSMREHCGDESLL